MGLAARKWLAALIVFLAACNRPPVRPARPAASEPKIRAVVITIQTTMPPSPKIWTHTIIIANDRARSSDEVDEWRLFDFKEKSVTFVDDLSKTYRKVSFDDLEAARRASLAQQLPEGMPRAQFVVGNAQKTLQGVVAKQSTIRIGAYQRELWIASHPLIPQGLFAIMQASAPASSPLASVMRQADEALIEIKGFPMSDHAELPYEKRKLVADNEVVKIERGEVAASWLKVDRAYRDVTAARPTKAISESDGSQHQ
jgi:hypothetical protein